ncbi:MULTISPECIES: FxLYD domain-containing protein [unclassified Streptomyces]|uniref:FxLYD domain-containing protein n=1 Tax=unclassified Streptomyces TaxID=2593676 RepID=UPI000A401162|nr:MULTISPECIES: FxLYD domain-containing protein [unclassified Streptomyces]
MSDNTPEGPEAVPAPPVPATPPTPVPPAPGGGSGRRGNRIRLVAAAAAVLVVGSGVSYWALSGDGDPMDHVAVSGGKLVTGDSDVDDDSDDDAYCDDTDTYTFNDCDTDDDAEPESTYEFVYKITNEGDEPANYSVLVNAFDKDGDYVGQTYLGVEHLAPGKTDADKSEFTSYGTFQDKHGVSDIASVKVAHVERTALAN